MSTPDGLLIVDKPADWTSHDVVARRRRLCETRKVGHAGTLDPMATGVLVLGVGRATRLLGHLALTDKAYDATIRLGQSTVTDDAEGDTLSESDTSHIDGSMITAATARLTGEIDQVPSAISAVKVGGRRAYKRVRAGEDVVLAARRVVVSEFVVEAVRRTAPHVDVDVHVECSTGTYVRALARDLGAALDVGGHPSPRCGAPESDLSPSTGRARWPSSSVRWRWSAWTKRRRRASRPMPLRTRRSRWSGTAGRYRCRLGSRVARWRSSPTRGTSLRCMPKLARWRNRSRSSTPREAGRNRRARPPTLTCQNAVGDSIASSGVTDVPRLQPLPI